MRRQQEILIQADLHVHTKYSADSSISPKTLADQLHSHPSIKAVAITDHDTIEGYFKVLELAASYTDVLVIPGVEITTPEGDLLVLGMTELPPKPWSVEGVIDFSRKRDGVVVVAHPYREHGLGSLAKNYSVDAVEVLNGGTQSSLNKLAGELAREMGLPGVAGSDSHNIEDLWSVYTEIEASLNVDEILTAIRKGFVRASSTRKSIHF
ncbi:MAG: PHP domain-containing protein [Candidatus Bathyarchaeia archaeon]